jgi:chemotaxis protein histidine kinase CheA/ActR/RegA family two-component response regulator
MCNPQALALLEEKIANNAYLLHEALRAAVIENQTNDAMAIVKQGVAYLQDISIAAGEAELQGLQTVCILSNQHLLQVVQQSDVSRKQAACAALEYFPKLVANYLQEPHNQLNQQALIKHLQRAEWTSPLPPETATLLTELLANDLSNSLIHSEQRPVEEPTIMAHEDVKLEPNEHDLALAAELDAAFNSPAFAPKEDAPLETSEIRFEELSLDHPVDFFEETYHFNNDIDALLTETESQSQKNVLENNEVKFDEFSLDHLVEFFEETYNFNGSDSLLTESQQNTLDTTEKQFNALLNESPIETIDELSSFNDTFDELLTPHHSIEKDSIQEENELIDNFVETDAAHPIDNTKNFDDLSWDDLAEEFNAQAKELLQEVQIHDFSNVDNVSFDDLAEEIAANIAEQNFEQLATDFDLQEEPKEYQDVQLENAEEFMAELQDMESQVIQEDALFQDNVFDEQNYTFLDERHLQETAPSTLEETVEFSTEELLPLTLNATEETFPEKLAEDFTADALLENQFVTENGENSPFEKLKEDFALSHQLQSPEKEQKTAFSLEETVANAAPILHDNIGKICSTTNEAELIQAISEYSQQINTISQAVEQFQSPALEEIMFFFKENLHELAMSSLEERQQAQAVFNAFPEFMFDYLGNPENQALNLISFLQNPDWIAPLSEQEATELLEKLQPIKIQEVPQISDIELNQIPALDTLSTPEEIPLEESLFDDISKNDVIALQLDELSKELDQFLETNDLENSLKNQEIAGLDNLSEDELNQIVGDAEETEQLAELESIENIQINQEVAFHDPFDDITISEQITNATLDDPFAISESELDNLQAPEEVDPFAISQTFEIENNESNQEVAFHDPFDDITISEQITNATLDDPFAISESELDNLQAPEEVDPFAISKSELDNSQETEVVCENVQDPFAKMGEEPLIEEVDPAILLEPVNNALMAAFDGLSAATQRVVSAEDESEELLEAVGNYTEVLQPILDAAESNSLTGILEVGNFLNENILALGMLPKAERQNLQENLDLFPALLLDYLLAPQESTDGLVEHLKNPNWSAPLSEERAEEIKATLLQIGQASVQESSDFNPLLGFDNAPVELETQPGDIYLGKPEQIERVNAALTESAEILSTSLENFVSMQNDNELFLEAVDTYTTHVQNIWDAAEQAGLSGLQDVCNFVNENIMALSAEDTEKRQLVHEQLDAWPMLMLNYLTAPQENISPLVEHLKHPNWMMPLDDSQADLLAKALQQGSTKSETPIEDPFADSFGITETTAIEETVEEESSSEGGDEISLGNSEMLEMLSGEIESAQSELDEWLEKFVNTPNNDPTFVDISNNYNELVGRLAMASEMVGLVGLKEVCDFVMSNVGILTEKSQSDRQKSKTALQKWPNLVLAYLKAPTNNIVALLNHFRENDWPSPLPDEKAHALLNNLRSSSSVPEDDGSEPSRATQAKPEDVILQIPEDVNQDLLAAYLQEAPQNAADFTACLQRIVKNPAPDDVKLGQRIAHTLKGSSNIIGIKGVATLAHNLEDILEYLFENAVPPPPALTKTMIEAADTLEIMIDSLQGKEEPPANALAILQEVLDWANRIDRNQLNVSDEEISKRKSEIAAQTANVPKPTAPTATGGGAAAAAQAPTAEAGEAEQYLRVPTRTVDNLLRLIGEMSISVGQIQERLKHAILSTKSLNSQGITVQHKGYELETLVVVRDVTNRRKHRLDGGNNIIAEDQEKQFDSLEFEQYNELHSLTHSFIESIADSRELGGSILEDLSALDGMFIHQERLNKEFQQIVMTTRMVPIKSIIARLERIVRQTCRSTEKLAELVMVGGDILIDGDVLTKLLDPLMHILRNSIDHGMELPADRIAAGKSETGTVTIRCYRQGNNIVVKCEDDGRGLNFERIRQIAVDRGLITENQELSPRELSRLILIPGFSTKGAVTQVSGRGVGMDVVHTSILELKGALEIESEPGRGSAMILILPMTLVTEHVLLVGVATQKFALPTHHLAQALTPDSGEFRRIGDSLNFHMDKNAYPVTTLADLLGLSGSASASEKDTRPLVLVKGEGNVTAVIVDYLHDSRNLVSKTMGRYVKKVRGVAGASILGDGSVVAMIDLPELLRQPAQSLMPLSSGGSEGESTAMIGAPHIMIVDDSLSVRKVLSQLIEDQGFQPMLAKDGLEAVEQVSQRKPDVMLVDMEMPRMNGIELTAHIRANEATKNIPIFMITSRTTEKHRQLAKEAGVSAYLTKPYQDTELLALINDALRNKH